MTEEPRQDHPDDPLTRPAGYEQVDPADLVSQNPGCFEVLGLKPGCSIDQVQDAYRRKVYHAQMDVAGACNQMPRLNQALAQAIRYVERSGPLAQSNASAEDYDSQGPPTPASSQPMPPQSPQARSAPTGPAKPSSQGSYQKQEVEPSTSGRKTPRKIRVPQSVPHPGQHASDKGTSGEALLGRFETEIALQLQTNPEKSGKGLYIVGSKNKSFPARVAFTSLRCLFESEYTAPVGLLRRSRYHRIRGQMAAAAIRAVHKAPDGRVEIHLAPHGPLQAMYPKYTNWVIRVSHLPGRLGEGLARIIASRTAMQATNDLGVLEVKRI